MKNLSIFTTGQRDILYQGYFPSFKACVEKAVREGVMLEAADLSCKNLSNAALDGAYMPRADFLNTNLTGANLSEACLCGARFTGASLFNTCLADSDLRDCNFEETSFGATDLGNSNISHACFSTLSCFDLDFGRVKAMAHCRFKNVNGSISRMSRPPLVIKGHKAQPIILMDDHIKIGNLTVPYIPKDGMRLPMNIINH